MHIPAPRIRTNGRPRGRENFGDSVKFSGMTQLHVDESKESHGVTSAKWPIVWLWHVCCGGRAPRTRDGGLSVRSWSLSSAPAAPATQRGPTPPGGAAEGNPPRCRRKLRASAQFAWVILFFLIQNHKIKKISPETGTLRPTEQTATLATLQSEPSILYFDYFDLEN